MTLTACHTCGRPSQDAYCDTHRNDSPAARRRASWRPGRGTKADRDLTHAVLERDRYVCHICGLGPDDGAPAADVKDHHPVPYAANGPTTMENLRAAHSRCNAVKGAGPVPS